MRKMKILNLYACLGGNRYKWNEVAKEANIEIEVTAVEIDPDLAKLYQERFPDDIVIVSDAHKYLLNHYKEFDFIWSSPPCTTHSRLRLTISNKKGYVPKFPDMKLYEEIIFLDMYFKKKYCVENVIPYYDPLIKGQQRGRHIYWTNFLLPSNLNEREALKGIIGCNAKNELERLCNLHEINLSNYPNKGNRIRIARNLVDFEVGRTIFEIALNIQRKSNTKQGFLFDEPLTDSTFKEY